METGEREKNGHFSTIGDKTGGNGTEMIKHTHTHTETPLSPLRSSPHPLQIGPPRLYLSPVNGGPTPTPTDQSRRPVSIGWDPEPQQGTDGRVLPYLPHRAVGVDVTIDSVGNLSPIRLRSGHLLLAVVADDATGVSE